MSSAMRDVLDALMAHADDPRAKSLHVRITEAWEAWNEAHSEKRVPEFQRAAEVEALVGQGLLSVSAHASILRVNAVQIASKELGDALEAAVVYLESTEPEAT